jgi:hypothetical protein
MTQIATAVENVNALLNATPAAPPDQSTLLSNPPPADGPRHAPTTPAQEQPDDDVKDELSAPDTEPDAATEPTGDDTPPPIEHDRELLRVAVGLGMTDDAIASFSDDAQLQVAVDALHRHMEEMDRRSAPPQEQPPATPPDTAAPAAGTTPAQPPQQPPAPRAFGRPFEAKLPDDLPPELGGELQRLHADVLSQTDGALRTVLTKALKPLKDALMAMQVERAVKLQGEMDDFYFDLSPELQEVYGRQPSRLLKPDDPKFVARRDIEQLVEQRYTQYLKAGLVPPKRNTIRNNVVRERNADLIRKTKLAAAQNNGAADDAAPERPTSNTPRKKAPPQSTEQRVMKALGEARKRIDRRHAKRSS